MLALVFGIQRFHTYLYARPLTIVTDHKPLVNITDKPIHSAPPRLQRMLMQIQGYNFTVRYRPGKEMILADALSRGPNTENNSPIQLDLRVDGIDIQLEDPTYKTIALINFSKPKQQQLKDETASDPILCELMNTILGYWLLGGLTASNNSQLIYEFTGHSVMSWLLKQTWYAKVVKSLYLKLCSQQSCNNYTRVIKAL